MIKHPDDQDPSGGLGAPHEAYCAFPVPGTPEQNTSVEDKRDNLALWILADFPGSIVALVLGLLAPLPLIHMLISGQKVPGIAGLALWSAALFFGVRYLRRRQYLAVSVSILVMYCLLCASLKLCP